MIDSIGIVIVLYKPKISEIKKNFLEYCIRGLNVVFVVNEASEIQKSNLKSVFNKYINTDLIFLKNNTGIAKAQNIGINHYFKYSNIENLLFFDQDSCMEINEIKKLQMMLYSEKIKSAALVGPGIYKYENSGICEVTETISSGSMIPVKVLSEIGLFKEDYFIDFVDYEWCWRAHACGLKVYVIGDVKINHQTENDVQRRFGHTMESPYRLYYIYRNLFWALKGTNMGFTFELKWLLRYFIKAFFQVTIANNRINRLKKISSGVFDGLFKYKR